MGLGAAVVLELEPAAPATTPEPVDAAAAVAAAVAAASTSGSTATRAFTAHSRTARFRGLPVAPRGRWGVGSRGGGGAVVHQAWESQ